ncbi:integrase family protein [Allomuricauda ruestringensis DSM 13258]|uniref:Integrase family protein n=1 Tax=Allomuricauda ruestringensis (strain DSM 13258 / CIP 107369 / LMG 19739 / B1) TaxID=886377 RepID=G2PMK4_ALLRU|nr:site-specific integrase [Allomuricauda ruestringensis]AEM72337.1 integrase family protein [Allomuricauda ruestringensis DSM 13258]
MVSLLFYLRKYKKDRVGRSTIYIRITVNGRRSEFSTGRKIYPNTWDATNGKVLGFSQKVRQLNSQLMKIRTDLFRHADKLKDKGRPLTAVSLKNSYLGVDKPSKMLLEIFQEHNERVEKLVGKDFAPGTAERYKTAKSHLAEYLQNELRKKDIPVVDVDHSFISGFEYYLKTKRKCSHNTAIKYVVNFKKIIRIAYANGWIKTDPFANWKARLKTVEREFLTDEELQRLMDHPFTNERLEHVRDCFVFCCFTGLAYADVKKLTHDDFVIGIDGDLWINTKRTKTKTKSNIPVLPTALMILEKYEHSPLLADKKVLPVLTNQKMNAYLKEIADLSGINKHLTTHLARHTFATTVTLSNGVSIESVSKMLGHKSLRTTQHYAKILNRKVSEDMQLLKKKLSFQEKVKSKNA